MEVMEEIIEAQNKSYVLGLKLKLPHYIVESIHKTHLEPQDRLLHILIEFTNRDDPKPTWRLIVDALKGRAVGLTELAKRMELKYCSDFTSKGLFIKCV